MISYALSKGCTSLLYNALNVITRLVDFTGFACKNNRYSFFQRFHSLAPKGIHASTN
jgi:hypothetical protein